MIASAMRAALGFVALLGMTGSSGADAPKAPKLTTATTAIYPSKSCKEQESALVGAVPRFVCRGLGGFEVDVYVSTDDIRMVITKSDYDPPVRVDAIKISKLEWRLADGKPFAVIAEVTVKDQQTKKLSKVFMVRGLARERVSKETAGTEEGAHDVALALADELASSSH